MSPGRVWQTEETTLGNNRHMLWCLRWFFGKKLQKNCLVLSLLHVLIFEVDRSFKIYGYLIFVSFLFLFQRKRVLLSFTSHVNHQTPNEAKV